MNKEIRVGWWRVGEQPRQAAKTPPEAHLSAPINGTLQATATWQDFPADNGNGMEGRLLYLYVDVVTEETLLQTLVIRHLFCLFVISLFSIRI